MKKGLAIFAMEAPVCNPYVAAGSRFFLRGAAAMIRAACLAALALAACPSDPAAAQSYPSRPISIVVPFPAGGPTDALTRIMAERMTSLLGQTIVVENVTGAAGTIAVGRVARTAPDGYTLVMGNLSTHVVNG